MSLGERIKEAREFKELTQRELADVLGVDPITVSRWERGKNELTPRKIRMIAEATGKPLAFFYEVPVA